MIIVNVLTSPVANSIINVGRQGENNAREVWFDLSWLIDTYGDGTATVLHKRKNDDAPYLVALTQENKTAAWRVNDLDTAYDGFGQCELRWTVGETLAKTITYRTIVQKSMTEDAVMPDPYASWYNQMIAYIDGITDRIEDSDASVTTLEPSQDATADVQFSAEGLHFSFGIPRGQDGADGLPGEDGADGQDGYTPVKGVDYFDGQDGASGKDGKDGADGHTPTITASKSGKVTTVSVDGTPIATINDGADGAVSSVNGQTGAVVLDAEDVGALPGSTPIPSKTSDLQNDSGFLTAETDPTVPSWAKQQTKPTYTATEVGALPDSTVIPSKTSQLQNDSGYGTYSKPSGGIPKSDLASDVQVSLGKADTALQSYTETDPTVPEWAKASTKPTYTASEVGAIAEPSTAGTSGQVLTSDGQGGQYWDDSTGGGTSDVSIKSTDAQDVDLDVTDPSGYVILRLADGQLQTKNFNSADSVGVEYKFVDGDLWLCAGFNATYDAVYIFNAGRANDLFDFSAYKLKPISIAFKDAVASDLTNVWTANTDLHAPFSFLATSNPDGIHADATSANYTGGNHLVDSTYKTATSAYIKFFADGKPVTSGYGKCIHFEMKWANNVQAYNCVKADGTGRTSLVEYHDMIFDGLKFDEKIQIIPSENIKMYTWYGLQCISIGGAYPNIDFIDGTNRQTFASTDSNIKSGNTVTSGLHAYGSTYEMEMNVDTNIDLGKRSLYSSGDQGAFCYGGKGYFTIISSASGATMNDGDSYYLNGSYRFYPHVS